jgi:hypothetical protein
MVKKASGFAMACWNKGKKNIPPPEKSTASASTIGSRSLGCPSASMTQPRREGSLLVPDRARRVAVDAEVANEGPLGIRKFSNMRFSSWRIAVDAGI